MCVYHDTAIVTFDEHSQGCGHACPDHDGCRGGEAERAGACDHDDRYREQQSKQEGRVTQGEPGVRVCASDTTNVPGWTGGGGRKPLSGLYLVPMRIIRKHLSKIRESRGLKEVC